MQSESLFRLVAATFAELGTEGAPVMRAFLHLDGYFVGHCFRCGDLHAVFKLNGEEVQFFSADGRLLRAVRVLSPEERDAA